MCGTSGPETEYVGDAGRGSGLCNTQEPHPGRETTRTREGEQKYGEESGLRDRPHRGPGVMIRGSKPVQV